MITLSASRRSSQATIGEMSNMPTRGMRRCSGRIIHSVRKYDQRIHFECGEIGSHDELLAADTKYAAMWRAFEMVSAT